MTALMPIPGPLDPVPVARTVTPRADGRVDLIGLTRPQIAALRYHGRLDLHMAAAASSCPWLVAAGDLEQSVSMAFDARQWKLVAKIPRPTDARENLLLYRKKP